MKSSLFLKLVNKIEENYNTYTLFFQPISDNDDLQLQYLPGQFITLKIKVNDAVFFRCYSITNSTIHSKLIAISFKVHPNGFISKVLAEKTSVGDIIEALPPAGYFTYKEYINVIENPFYLFVKHSFSS